MLKGRIATQWKLYTAQHLNAKGIKLKMQEWVPKLINAMWDHIARLWHYHYDAVHIRDTKQVAQFKIDTLEREKDRIKKNTKNCDTRYNNSNQGIWKGW
jgi:hypothetical protein